MFHNFLLKNDKEEYISFFWFRNNEGSHSICQYHAKVHIFCNFSRPGLASLELRYAVNHASSLEYVRSFINEQFYVDDGLLRAHTVENAVTILSDTTDILKNHNIRLHKMFSSSSDVMKAFPESKRVSTSSIDLKENSVQSALGLTWDIV